MIENGCKIKFRPDWTENADEIFIVSGWDGTRGWAGDKSGRGWYFRASQVIVIDDEEDEPEED